MISSHVKISKISLISSLPLKLYFSSLVYHRNIFGSSSKVFGNLRKPSDIFENFRKFSIKKCSGTFVWPSEQFWIISYILRFRIKFRFVKKRFGFYFHQSERRNEFLTREKIVSSNHKPRFKRIVFSRAFSRSSRVALSGSFDKILYFRCTRVVRNSNFQVIKS